ncbi:hypothetical protein S40293_01544 [Stachybotrys chartarum IBT 40293]|nr:hypothetical protein S40293_01544 [Stachybotrys chartarum IBT 40293]
MNSRQGHLDVANSLLLELEHFLNHLGSANKALATGIPAFIRSVRKETSSGVLSIHGVTAITHARIHWDVLKRCRSFVAINQTFQGSSKEDRRREALRQGVSGKEKERLTKTLREQGRVVVHVVEGGKEWLDVRFLQEDRLARQLADCGWGWGDHAPGDHVDEDEWEDTALAKHVKRLVSAARMNRHDYRLPRIRLVLPKISAENADIAVFLEQLSRLDPAVELLVELKDGKFLATPPPDLDAALEDLIGNEFDALTQTLNLDHPLLIDMISDITHLHLEVQPWHHRTTQVQILEEQQKQGLMARTLYRILGNRKLVCTRQMAEHFHEVLSTVGTNTERERGRLLVPLGDDYRSTPPSVLRERFASLSTHPPPDTVQIPVTILHDETWDIPAVHRAIDSGRLPAVALDVARCGDFKSSRLSVYMYGWASGHVIVTSNKEIGGQIRTWLEANRHADDEVGPSIWRVNMTRNLLASSATPPPWWVSENKGPDEVNVGRDK